MYSCELREVFRESCPNEEMVDHEIVTVEENSVI